LYRIGLLADMWSWLDLDFFYVWFYNGIVLVEWRVTSPINGAGLEAVLPLHKRAGSFKL